MIFLFRIKARLIRSPLPTGLLSPDNGRAGGGGVGGEALLTDGASLAFVQFPPETLLYQ